MRLKKESRRAIVLGSHTQHAHSLHLFLYIIRSTNLLARDYTSCYSRYVTSIVS